MTETIRVCVPQILRERGLTANDLMYGARLAPGTAYKLASEEEVSDLTGISFDVLLRVCKYLNVGISDVLKADSPGD